MTTTAFINEFFILGLLKPDADNMLNILQG